MQGAGQQNKNLRRQRRGSSRLESFHKSQSEVMGSEKAEPTTAAGWRPEETLQVSTWYTSPDGNTSVSEVH